MKAILLVLPALLGTLAPAQVLPAGLPRASYTTYGKICAGRFGSPANLPKISATGLPKLGGTCRVHYTGPYKFPGCRVVGVGAMLLTGLSRDRLGAVRLPWRLPTLSLGGWSLGGKDCFLLTSGEAFDNPTWSALTVGFKAFTVPNNPSLLGMRLYQQWWLFYMLTCGNLQSWAFATNGGIMTIGL